MLRKRIAPRIPTAVIADYAFELKRIASVANEEALAVITTLAREPTSHDLAHLEQRIVDRTIVRAGGFVESVAPSVAEDAALFAVLFFGKKAKASGVDLKSRIARNADSRVRKDARKLGASGVGRRLEREFGVSLEDPRIERRMRAFAVENASTVSDLAAAQAKRVGELVSRGVVEGVPMRELTSEIRGLLPVESKRARAFAERQVIALNAAMTEELSAMADITWYRWRTMGDTKVRPRHRKREDKRYMWSRPPRGGHPGEDYGCRCTADPEF